MKKNKWSCDEVNSILEMHNSGKSYKEMSIAINRTQVSISRKMLNMGYKSNYKPHGTGKYLNYNWDVIQREYDNGLTYKGVCEKFSISTKAMSWAKHNNKLKLRTLSDALLLARQNGKFNKTQKEDYEKYRVLCEFKFNLNDYPNKFDFNLINEHGWYQAKNRGDNSNGVTRDHMFSVKDGYVNKINPLYISHPANCMLLLHLDNISKGAKSSISLNELFLRINEWDGAILINNNKYHSANQYVFDSKKSIKIINNKNHCEICNSEISEKSKKCLKCYRLQNRKVQRPELDVLLDDILKMGYVGTGKKYGVSDNAIRKWKNYYAKCF